MIGLTHTTPFPDLTGETCPDGWIKKTALRPVEREMAKSDEKLANVLRNFSLL
jgi:hypothetical protein